MTRYPVTNAGYVSMEAELRTLKTVDRPAVIKAIAEAREHGDLSENAEYSAAREKQSFIEGRIGELEARISRAEVIDPSKLSGETVKFGATVTVIDEDSEEQSIYQIVGDIEADVTARKLAISAPLGRALIGKKKGDSVEVGTPKGLKFYEVMKVEYK